jgi:hypothetical protein
MDLGPESPEELDPYGLPASLLGARPWTETNEIVAAGCSRARRVTQEGRAGIRKPGEPGDGSLEAVKEIVASVVASWLGVNVPQGELVLYNGRPCFVSYDLGPTAYPWVAIMTAKQGLALRPAATEALANHCGIFVLDALVGAEDRRNGGNHIFVPSEGKWYSLDYAFSFNTRGVKGVGDPEIPFRAQYYAEMLAAVKNAPGLLEEALSRAESIPLGRFQGLLAMVPAEFAAPAERDQMVAFLENRRPKLRILLQEWCNMSGLTGLIKNAKR